MKRSALLLILFTVILATGCVDALKSITGSGNVITQNREVGPFTGIEAGAGVMLIIEPSSITSVEVEADDNIQEHLKTTVSGGTLKIESEFNNFSNATLIVRVKTPRIEKVSTSGGVNAESKGVIKGDKLKLDASSGSRITFEVEVDDLKGETSSGSQITLTGKAIEADFESSSGSTIEADKLLSNEVYAEASSGSSISVQPLVKIHGKASSGGSVRYVGSPKEIKRDESSGGSVSGS